LPYNLHITHIGKNTYVKLSTSHCHDNIFLKCIKAVQKNLSSYMRKALLFLNGYTCSQVMKNNNRIMLRDSGEVMVA